MVKNCLLLLLLALTSLSATYAQRRMENLGRGVVASRTANNQALVSWRLLGTEPQDIAFNLYRSENGAAAQKLNPQPLTAGTNFVDNTLKTTVSNSYFIRTVRNGVEGTASLSYTLLANTPVQPYYSVPIIETPGYYVLHVNVGDLDGDGEYDFVLDKQPTVDGFGPQLVEAYKRDGTFLWQINLGPNSLNRDNILPGSSAINIGHADNITVYDINNDGKAEVILRTSNGVTFADGKKIVNPNNDVQYMTVINGLTGTEISSSLFNNPYVSRGPMTSHLGIAYLDGINPSVVWEAKNRKADGSFNELTTAWDWKNNTLEQKWQYYMPDTGAQKSGHQIRCADLDEDGKDEIVPFGYAIDDDGKQFFDLSLQDIYHGDRFFISDMDPHRPGKELYGIQQGYSKSGIMWHYIDARTGEVLLAQYDPANRDLGRGYAGDLDPRYDGYEFHTFVDGLYNVSGVRTSSAIPGSFPNLRVWWDGDLLSENLDGQRLSKWNHLTEKEERLLTPTGVLVAPRYVPAYYGDIIGDWREELIYASSDNKSLRIYTTPYPSDYRLYTLPHNPQYRNDMTAKGYNQSYMVDYYLGHNMEQPPLPPIQKADKYWDGKSSATWTPTGNTWLNNTNQNDSYTNGDVVMFDIRGNNTSEINISSDYAPSKVWLVNPEGKDYKFGGSGKLTGDMELVKMLKGNLTLNGNHDYTGNSVVEEGTFTVNGMLQSKVWLKTRGNVAGVGVLKGGLLLQKGQNVEDAGIRPGNGSLPGTLSIIGDVELQGGNNLEFDIAPTKAGINDSLKISGNLKALGSNNIIVKFENSQPIAGSYTLVQVAGNITADLSNFVLKGLDASPAKLVLDGKLLKLVIAPQRAPATVNWIGSVNGAWDFETENFKLLNANTAFVGKDSVVFSGDATTKQLTLNKAALTSGLNFQSGEYQIQGDGAIAGEGGLLIGNNVKLNLGLSQNTYTGATIVDGAELKLETIGMAGKPSSLGSASVDASNIRFNNASITVNQRSVTNRGFSLSGTNKIIIPANQYLNITTGDIKGNGQLIKEGEGGLYILGKKSFTGTTLIKSGQVNLRRKEGNEMGLGGGTVTLEGGALNLEDIRDYAQIKWSIIVPEGKSASLSADGRSTMSGTLTGAGTLSIQLPYVRTDFAGDWSGFKGTLNLSGSDFRIGNKYGYGNSEINLKSGNIYTISGAASNIAIGALSGDVGGAVYGASYTVGAKNTDAVFSGSISGTGSVTKVGTGTWTVNGSNTFTGAVQVNAGRLLVNGATGKARAIGSGAVNVANGARIGGTGTIKGALTIADGGILELGSDGIGTLTDSSSVTLATGAITEVEINKPGFKNDKLMVLGNLAYGGILKVANAANNTFADGDSFKIFEANSFSGDFDSIQPESPGAGLKWVFSASTGVLSVEGGAPIVLPDKNFTVFTTDETCNISNNGKITISAKANFTYQASLATKNYSFSNASPLVIENLVAGNYTLVITIPGQDKFEQQYQLTINEPKPLSVFAMVDKKSKTLALSMAGGAKYQVVLNGKVLETADSTLTLNLAGGNNKLSVTTDKDCQGIFEQTVFVSETIKVSPNPVKDRLTIDVSAHKVGVASIKLFDISGRTVFESKQDFNAGVATINVEALPAGLYNLQLSSAEINTNVKIVKQ
ncbi:rhamnogalacturonan lyase family protein [Pelobium manganitolerans]|uniref:rhamnogalacturonan lyase family protein n=1 Tax=Pelobium manganitolerans TaxID=1842495 RepID=UPI003FA3DB7C